MRIYALAAAIGLLACPALAQQVSPGPAPVQPLYATGASVGNTADTTEDILQTYTLPAGQLAITGDRLHIVAGGTLAGTTDSKNIRVRIGGLSGTAIASRTLNATNNTTWTIDAWVVKTGSNTQTYTASFNGNGASATALNGTAAVTDTSTIQIVVTGQDSTASTANAVTCNFFSVDFKQ